MTAYDGTNGNLLFFLESNNLENQFGRAVCGLGDIDNDGVGDFAVGAPHEDGLAPNGGRALLYRGAITDDCTMNWMGSVTAGGTASLELLGMPSAGMLLMADVSPGPVFFPAYGTISLGLTPYLTTLADSLGLLGPAIGDGFDGQGIAGFGPVILDASLSGTTVFLQGFAMTPLAPNGVFQRSLGLGVTIL